MHLRAIAAHALSLIGHPAVLTPLALFAATEGSLSRAPALAAVAVAAAVMAFSAVQVWRGRWVDTDASRQYERIQLNLFLAALLCGGAIAAWGVNAPAQAIGGFAFAAAIIVCALLLRHALKLSLHVAFATFAASFFWPDWRIVVAMLGLAATIAWARLELRRHTRADLLAGALAGAAAGFALTLLA